MELKKQMSAVRLRNWLQPHAESKSVRDDPRTIHACSPITVVCLKLLIRRPTDDLDSTKTVSVPRTFWGSGVAVRILLDPSTTPESRANTLESRTAPAEHAGTPVRVQSQSQSHSDPNAGPICIHRSLAMLISVPDVIGSQHSTSERSTS